MALLSSSGVRCLAWLRSDNDLSWNNEGQGKPRPSWPSLSLSLYLSIYLFGSLRASPRGPSMWVNPSFLKAWRRLPGHQSAAMEPQDGGF